MTGVLPGDYLVHVYKYKTTYADQTITGLSSNQTLTFNSIP